jgi:hypothetical protein
MVGILIANSGTLEKMACTMFLTDLPTIEKSAPCGFRLMYYN